MRFWGWQILPVLVLAVMAVVTVGGPLQSAGVVQAAEARNITVFAAASMKSALDVVAADYQRTSGNKVVLSYASSAALAKQIEQAAPADVFLSADLDWVDYLADKGLIDTATRSNLLGNRLVLIAPATSTASLKIADGMPLADAIGAGRLAVGDVASVPAGKYAKAALEKLGVWKAVEPKLAQVENVRAALALVARGEATLGIVYQTDAAAEPNVRIVDTFPEATHPAIIYPIAVMKAATPDAAAAAAALIAYLRTAPAAAIFERAGFTMLAP